MTNKCFFIAMILLTVSSLCYSQEDKDLEMRLSSSDVNTPSVLTSGKLLTEVFNKSKVLYHYNYTIQVNNNSNENDRTIVVPFSKFEKVENLKILIKDINGKKIKEITKKDMINQAMVDNVTIMSDDRILYYRSLENKLPYFIHTEYTIESKQSFQLLPFSAKYFGMKINKFDYELRNYDIGNQIKFVPSYWGDPIISNESDFILYTYKISIDDLSLYKMKNETNFSIKPILVNFSMDDIDGSMETWTSFGNWIYKLNEGTEVFDDETQAKILSLVKDAKDDKEKTKILYAFLQEQMRYVSIQLGIGGFKPFSAQYVHNNKYGDCKALSNYMRSILKLVGIKSHYVIITAGRDIPSLTDDFAMNVFNHAILAVPFTQDTVFLECTSNNADFGYIGSFTSNRKGLLIDIDNSKLVETSSLNYLNNIINTKTNINPLKERNVQKKTTMKGMGVEYMGYYATKNWVDEEFVKYWSKHLSIDKSGFALEERSYTPHSITYSYLSPTIAKKTGSRYFVKLKLDKEIIEEEMNSWSTNPAITFGFVFEHEFVIQVPPNCVVEKSPISESYDKGPLIIDLKVALSDHSLNVKYDIAFKEGDYQELDANTRSDIYTKYTMLENKVVVLKCTEDSRP